MKILSATLAALFALGIAGAASAACGGYAKPVADQSAQAPVIVQPGASS